MKRKLLLSTALVISFFSQAQVPNGGFEIITTDNHISQWAKNYLLSITIDSTGEMHGDSVVFDHPDNQLYRATTDAHTGTYAMEMTNGFNYTTNSGYIGGAFLASSDFYAAIFPETVYMDPVQPETFSFYYKYFPQASDSAQAILTLFDIDGFQIAETSVTLGGTVSDYTQVVLPIQYTVSAPAYAMSIAFSTAANGNQPTLGTKFIVDDVELNGNLGIYENELNKTIYPNPANTHFTIMHQSDDLSVFSSAGKKMDLKFTADGQFDCSAWANGFYFVYNISGEVQKLVVSH